MVGNIDPAPADGPDINAIGPIPRPDGSVVGFGEDGQPYDESNRAYSGFPALENLAQSTEVEDSATQTALEGLFSAPTESQPPSSEGTKRKAGTSRINMLARGGACEFCKKRKLKCTAEEPSCAACLRIGKECVYSQKKQRSKVRQLEDRLAELEKRLEEAREESTPVDNPIPEPDDFWDRFPDIHRTTADVGFTLTAGFTLPTDPKADQETLMTLADAAASDVSYLWKGMSEVEIASEIVKAVEGGKGVGEKIVGHL